MQPFPDSDPAIPKREPVHFDVLPRLLRWIGASVLVVAAFTFMLQSWAGADDLLRYFHFLGFTATLGAAGFFSGLRIRDEKGARTFLGLAVGTVLVHFTVLGALLYSQFPWLSGFTDYPGYAHYVAPHPAAALVTAAVGVALLVPVCWTAFLTFARSVARPATVAFLAANATLLIPTRNPDAIGALALVLLAATITFDRRVLAQAPGIRTLEGWYVRALLMSPFAMLVGRTFNLYEASSLFLAAVFASATLLLFSLLHGLVKTREGGVAAQYAALVPAAGVWVALADAATTAFGLGSETLLPLICLPTAVLYAGLSLHALDGGANFRRLTAFVASGGMLLQLVLFPGVVSSLLCLGTAIVAAGYGRVSDQRGVFGTGMAALGFGLLYHLRYAADLYALSPWATLAGLGIVTVLAASWFERNHRSLAVRLGASRARATQQA